VNLLPLRVQVQPEDRFSLLLANVRRICLDAQHNGNYPFDLLLKELRIETLPGRSPLFDVGFSWNGMEHAGRSRFADLNLSNFGEPPSSAKYDLLMIAGEGEQSIKGVIEYNADLFDRESVAAMARQFLRILEQVAGGQDPSIIDLEMDTSKARAASQSIGIELNF
jgi:non-ribosomal peptide synthetase component F